MDAIAQQLPFEPTIATGKRKQLRQNRTAAWELRVGDFRVLYDVDDRVQIVAIVMIGEKRGNALFARGKRKDK